MSNLSIATAAALLIASIAPVEAYAQSGGYLAPARPFHTQSKRLKARGARECQRFGHRFWRLPDACFKPCGALVRDGSGSAHSFRNEEDPASYTSCIASHRNPPCPH
jgi:hypothetical protein